jgi:hypothetical protein
MGRYNHRVGRRARVAGVQPLLGVLRGPRVLCHGGWCATAGRSRGFGVGGPFGSTYGDKNGIAGVIKIVRSTRV